MIINNIDNAFKTSFKIDSLKKIEIFSEEKNSIKKNKKETISIEYQLDLMCICFSALKALQTGKTQKIKYL